MGATGYDTGGRKLCILKNKFDGTQHTLSLNARLANEYEIVSIASLSKNDDDIQLVIKDQWRYNTIIFNPITKKSKELRVNGQSPYNASFIGDIIVYTHDNKILNNDREIFITKEMSIISLEEELVVLS